MGVAGILLAIASVIAYAPRPAEIMGLRERTVRDIRVGPEWMVGCSDEWISPNADMVGERCYRAPVGDDPAMYVWALLMPGEPAEVFKWTGIGLLAAVLLTLPSLLYAVGGPVAALLSPLVLIADPLLSFDVYWAGAIAMLAGLPLILLASREWRPWIITAVLVLAVGASAIRYGAGLPLLVGATVVIVQHGRWRWLPLVVGAYLMPSLWASSHPFWHSIYIGLGYLPNDYGITYADAVGTAIAVRDTGSAVYGSGYEGALRDEVLRLVSSDPGFVVRSVLSKALAMAAPIALVALLLPRRLAVVALSVLCVALLPGVLVIPHPAYVVGWTMGVVLTIIIVVSMRAGRLPPLTRLRRR